MIGLLGARGGGGGVVWGVGFKSPLMSKANLRPCTWPLHHHHLQLNQQGSCHLGGVFGVVVMLENSF